MIGSRISQWINDRFPLRETWQRHASKYFAPRNLNFWYMFGAFSLLVLLNQILTGIWLTMYYEPSAKHAFASVEHIMRDVRFGWLLRYLHTTGASAFFVVVYLHMYRGIMYGSYKAPRELVWLIGMCIFMLLMVEAGSGYVLPWGQMSYWATKVLVSIFTVIPWVGKEVATWVAGDYNVSGVTLHRFFALHVAAIPLVIIFMTFIHLVALHRVGSNNPKGIDVKKGGKDTLPFHPYYTVKDFMGVVVFLIVFLTVVFYFPAGGGYFLESTNYYEANPLVTPVHIAPPWYLAPLYAILRAIPNKLLGVVMAAAAVAILFVLPWLDRSPVRSIRYRGNWTKAWITIFVVSFIALGVMGTMTLSTTITVLSRIFLTLYFLYFLLMPWYTRYEKCKPLPDELKD